MSFPDQFLLLSYNPFYALYVFVLSAAGFAFTEFFWFSQQPQHSMYIQVSDIGLSRLTIGGIRNFVADRLVDLKTVRNSPELTFVLAYALYFN